MPGAGGGDALYSVLGCWVPGEMLGTGMPSAQEDAWYWDAQHPGGCVVPGYPIPEQPVPRGIHGTGMLSAGTSSVQGRCPVPGGMLGSGTTARQRRERYSRRHWRLFLPPPQTKSPQRSHQVWSPRRRGSKRCPVLGAAAGLGSGRAPGPCRRAGLMRSALVRSRRPRPGRGSGCSSRSSISSMARGAALRGGAGAGPGAATPRGKLRQSPGEGRWSGGGSAGCARRGGLEAGTGSGGGWGGVRAGPVPRSPGQPRSAPQFPRRGLPWNGCGQPRAPCGGKRVLSSPHRPTETSTAGPGRLRTTPSSWPAPPENAKARLLPPPPALFRAQGERQSRAHSPAGTGAAPWGTCLPRAHCSSAPVTPPASSRVPWDPTTPRGLSLSAEVPSDESRGGSIKKILPRLFFFSLQKCSQPRAAGAQGAFGHCSQTLIFGRCSVGPGIGLGDAIRSPLAGGIL